MKNKIMDKNSLEYFINETHIQLDGFKEAYLKKSSENPEYYPLVLDSDNVGLWLEFFINYVTDGSV